jgi:hypothetical protein
MEDILQLEREISGRGLSDEGFRRGQQRAVPKETNPVERPQAALVEVGDFGERIEGTTMGIAGAAREFLACGKQ